MWAGILRLKKTLNESGRPLAVPLWEALLMEHKNGLSALVSEKLHEHPVVPHVVEGQLGRPVGPVGVLILEGTSGLTFQHGGGTQILSDCHLGLDGVVAQVDRLVAGGQGEGTGTESGTKQ